MCLKGNKTKLTISREAVFQNNSMTHHPLLTTYEKECLLFQKF